MEADFSGYATKSGLKCSDGRTIRSGAFQHQDKSRVPLVWQHQHDSPENILGHAMLEDRPDGTYAYAYFNDNPSAKEAKELVKHGDIVALSIFANKLKEQDQVVSHGMIREVSLVLSGANPGASIEFVNLAHGEGDEALGEAVIYTGLDLEHSDPEDEVLEDQEPDKAEPVEESTVTIQHNEGATVTDTATKDASEETVKDVFDSMSEKQQNVVYFMIGEAVSAASDSDDDDKNDDEDQDDKKELAQSDSDTNSLQHQEGQDMTNRNIFEGSDTRKGPTLSHDQIATIIEDAKKPGSTFKESFLAHAQDYGITDIDILFPDAKAVANSPELIARRQEWVADVLSGVRKSPFSRIKSIAADITAEEARAKGYVKGNLKKDEIIKLLKRVTTPTTVYKKQKLDRDDILDITDLDVVAWLKGEMRLMLDEELARAVLIGDGREADDLDKIDEDHLRPIADDSDMYAHKITIPGDLAPAAIIEAVLRARSQYKGTGTPTFYTTDGVLTDLILEKDKVGRRLYDSEQSLAAALRVAKVIVVEAMESRPEILGIMVNIADYTLGADRGGQVSMFDDFDIDYNQQKYLLETRVSGALTKPKSAVIVRQEVGTSVVPQTPSYDGATHTITVPSIAGVVYSIDGSSVSGDVVITETTDVEARPASGYSFPANTVRDWTYVYTA